MLNNLGCVPREPHMGEIPIELKTEARYESANGSEANDSGHCKQRRPIELRTA